MEKGLVFNIQKFSIHDGPGIRTTIFLKGCPLRCEWCANPESQLDSIQILYDENKCCHCQTCIHTCKENAIQLIDNQIIIDHDACKACLACVQACPNKALKQEGDYKEINDIVKTCLQDIDFYEESNGGITISGGEGMSQPAFLKELIQELKKQNLHVAIETTGYIQPHIFQELAQMLDLLLFDVKHYDSNIHYQKTGVHNELILENLTWAIQNHIDVLPRIPVIPDFNAELKDAKGFVNLFHSIGIQKVQLLPFHQFGQNKYAMLHKEYVYKDKKALYKEDLQEYQQVFIQSGIDCFF